MYVRGLEAGYHYAYRVDGPWTGRGHRFDRKRCCSTRTRRANTNTLWEPGDACGPGDNLRSRRCAA